MVNRRTFVLASLASQAMLANQTWAQSAPERAESPSSGPDVRTAPLTVLFSFLSRADSTPLDQRSRASGHTFNIFGATETDEGFERERGWVRDFWDALAPHHVGVYVNFLMEEGEERVREAYGADRYDRLKALKRRYDQR